MDVVSCGLQSLRDGLLGRFLPWLTTITSCFGACKRMKRTWKSCSFERCRDSADRKKETRSGNPLSSALKHLRTVIERETASSVLTFGQSNQALGWEQDGSRTPAL